MTRYIGLTMTLVGLATLAGAQGTPDQLEACYQKPDGAPRLACFNDEMQRRRALAPAATAAVPTPAIPAARMPAGNAQRQSLTPEAAQTSQPIVASVVRVVPRSHSESAFVLDNGQTWEEVEIADNLHVGLHDTVTIKPGIMGSFFLSTPRSQRVRVRVRRIV
jgi:hypothetical protein